MKKSQDEQSVANMTKDAKIQHLQSEVARLEKLNEWEKARRLALESEVADLKEKLRAQRRARATVTPW